jgi:chorismate-pyruvate lyase
MYKGILMQAKAVTRELISTSMSQLDLMDSLQHNTIEPSRLSTFQRIILTTDGTLTDILEAYLSEKIRLVKLSEETCALTQEHEPLALAAGQEVLERKIVLQGHISHKNWVYAESLLVPERLEQRFRNRLIISQEPMGRLWLEYRMETFKEIVRMYREPAENLAPYFGIQHQDMLLCRTYLVFSNRQPIIMITEKFPESFFQNTF